MIQSVNFDVNVDFNVDVDVEDIDVSGCEGIDVDFNEIVSDLTETSISLLCAPVNSQKCQKFVNSIRQMLEFS